MSLYEITAFSLKYSGPVRNLNLVASGYLRYEEKEVYSSTAKFVYEEVRTGLGRGVHFRCIYNNNYLVRDGDTDWITATAIEPVEDPTRQDCTLFQLDVMSNSSMSWVHVNTNKTVAIASPSDPVYGFYLTLNSNYTTSVVECIPIDVQEIIKLPKTVVFRADNDKYLMQGVSQLSFIGEDRHEVEAWYETFPVNNGDVRFKSAQNDRFLRRDNNNGFIVADSYDTTSTDSNTVFQIARLNDYAIGLINRGNNKFCQRIAGSSNQFKADTGTGVKGAALVIEEPIVKRTIKIKYRLEDARIYDEIPRSWLSQVAFNNAKSRDLETNLTIKYVETLSFSSNTTTTVSTNVTSTTVVEASIPFIGLSASETLEISAGSVTETALSDKQDKSEIYEFTCTVRVPPGEKRVARIMALEAKCDVPFSYIQTDYLANGEKIKTNLQDGAFTGMNGYEFHAQVYDPDEPDDIVYDEPVATRSLPNTFSRRKRSLKEK